jgi:hypothetical protein
MEEGFEERVLCPGCRAIQILTTEELLHNAEVKMPPQFGMFKQAQ